MNNIIEFKLVTACRTTDMLGMTRVYAAPTLACRQADSTIPQQELLLWWKVLWMRIAALNSGL
jgi:hypothetical protein